jgi:alpha-L-rhamnosidase
MIVPTVRARMTPHARSFHPSRRLLAQLVVVVTTLAMMLTAAPAVAAPDPSGSAVTLDALKVERKIEPVGIDVAAPRFAWLVESSSRDVKQESYRVRVSASDDVVWDSGVVESDRSFDVEYDGPALKAATRYDWTVDVVTTAGEADASSSFRTGLMDEQDWGDSTWIGATSPVDDALALWDDYTADFDFTIDAFSFGAFVRAPSASDALMWQVSVADGTPRLRPHRRVNGSYTLLANPGVDLSSFVTVKQLTEQSNRLSVTVSAGTDATSVTVVTRLNGQQVDSRVVTQAGTMQRGFVGLRSDTNGGQPERSRLHALTVTRTSDGTVLADHDFTDGDNPFTAGTVTDGSLQLSGSVDTVLSPRPAAAPLMRKEFTIDKAVRNATYYVAAGGYADVSLNGDPISKDVLSPGYTDYDDHVQYAATDVTDQLVEGRNALGMELGRGFFGMTGGNVWRWESPPWHAEPRARGVLAIEYADGSTQRVVTDDSWTFHEGPTQFDDLYAGEVYRASGEIPGWDVDGFDDSSWRAVREVTGPKGTLVNQRQQPIRITESLPAVGITEPADGVYVVKFPRVVAGVVEYTAAGPAGTTIKAAHGEKLRSNGRVNIDNNGGFQAGFQTDRFILAGTGKAETWTPKFSYKGFQYIEVTGWPGDEAPPLSAFTAKLLHTDAERTGSFESSSATMNGTHEAVVNTLYNNIHGIPTDTPMFEKNGWTGDAAVGAEMFMMNLDVHELFAKWMGDVQDSREANGAPMVIAPSSGDWGAWGPSQPWHSAYVNIPWWLFQYGGDDRVMTELYDGMKTYVDLEYGRRRSDGTVISNRLGDWVSPEGSPAGGHAPDEDQRVEGTAYLFTMLETMERTARHLGKDADATRFAEQAQTVKTDFNKAYFDSAKDRYRGEGADGNRYRQVHNVLALQFGLTPDAATTQRVADRLAADVVQRGYHLDTGVLGTKYLLPVLTKHGHADVAYKLATQTTYPSWGYKLENGATSMWEHWKLESRSLGHYFLGTVDDWFYRDVAGIRPSEETGYRDVTIAPQVTGEMTWAKATTQTPYGPVTSDWRRSGRSVRLDASVPVGSTATVVLPGEAGSTITEAGQPAADAAGVRDATYADGEWTLTVGSRRPIPSATSRCR